MPQQNIGGDLDPNCFTPEFFTPKKHGNYAVVKELMGYALFQLTGRVKLALVVEMDGLFPSISTLRQCSLSLSNVPSLIILVSL